MAKLLKLRRGSTTQHASFTGAEGEVTIDTTKDTAVVHDGAQAGGRPLAREDMSNVSSAAIAGQLGTDSISVDKIAAGTLPNDVKVNSNNIINQEVKNEDVSSSAAIAGTKISPNFGSQNIATTGTASTGQLIAKAAQEPQIIVQDSDTSHTGTSAENGISFRDGGGTQQSMIGHNNSGDKDFYLDTAGTDHRINFRVGGSTTQLEIEDSAVNVTGNLAVSGTVDGRDVAADGSKLDTYEANGSSYLRSDANDSTSGSINFTNSYHAFGNGTGSVSNDGGWNARVNIAGSGHARFDVKSVSDGIITTMSSHSGHSKGYIGVRSSGHSLGFYSGGSERADLSTAGSLSTTVQGTLWGASNDGSGSGLDADLLDGVDSGSFARSDADDTLTGIYNFHSTGNYPIVIGNTSGTADAKLLLRGSSNPYIRFREGNTDKAYMQWNSTGYVEIYNEHTSRSLRIKGGSNFLIANVGGTEHAVWHGGNDGSGSGLDADTVDGIQAANFVRSDTQDTKSGALNINGGTSHGANDATLYVDADNNNDWGIICNKLNNGSTEYGIESRIAASSSFALSVLGGGTRVFRVGGNGDIVNNGSITANGNVTAYSDARLKTNVNTINDALSIVGKLRGVSFDWKESGEHSIGVIAQEVEEVLPELVLTNHENIGTKEKPEYTDFKSVDYGKIVGVLINAINELKAEVDELKGGK